MRGGVWVVVEVEVGTRGDSGAAITATCMRL